MPRPVCTKCKRDMQIGKAVTVQYNATVKGESRPYQSWHGDLATCDGCGAQVVTRWGLRPLWESHNVINRPEPDIVVEERPRTGA